MWLRLQPRRIHDCERLVAGSVHHGFRGSHGCLNLMGSSLDFIAPLRLLRLFAANPFASAAQCATVAAGFLAYTTRLNRNASGMPSSAIQPNSVKLSTNASRCAC